MLLLAACAASPSAEGLIASLPLRAGAARFELPRGVSLDDGLDEDEAAALALRGDASFRAGLAELGEAAAAEIEARLLPDRALAGLFPVGSRPPERTGGKPLAAARPRPLGTAARDLERAQQELVQRGRQLVYDARLAHSEAVLAQERARLSREAALARAELAGIAQARVQAGDLSELEAGAVQLAALRARAEAAQRDEEAARARGRLWLVLGIDGPAAPERLELVGRGAPLTPAPEIAALLGGGSAPPDVREARASYERAREAQQLWQTAIAPQAQAVLERTRAAYASGQESYRIVLEATRQRLELAACEAQVVAEARRAAAELELRVGRRAFGAD